MSVCQLQTVVGWSEQDVQKAEKNFLFQARNVTKLNGWYKKKLGRTSSLSGKSRIDLVFSKGSHFFIYPFRFQYFINPDSSDSPKVLFSVSKRNFKKATDRNLIRRRMREAFRLNQHLLNTFGKSLYISHIYSAKEILDFHSIEEKLISGIKRLTEKLSLSHDQQKN